MKPTEHEIATLIEQHGFSQHKQALLDSIEPAVQLVATPSDEGLIEIGATKFGGLPDIPEDMTWPTHKGQPLAFLGQIRLSDLPADIPDWPLPETGRLWFWYELNEMPWGFDPKDAGGFRVTFEPNESVAVARRAWPRWPDGIKLVEMDEFVPFRACTVAAHIGVSFSVDFEELLLDDEDAYDRLQEFQKAVFGRELGEGVHRVLGQPNAVQGEMSLECQLVSNGIYCGDEPPRSARAKIKRLTPGAADWRMLLQIDTDEQGPDWMWGDMGCLYFWIRKQDLDERNFDRIWAVLQCS